MRLHKKEKSVLCYSPFCLPPKGIWIFFSVNAKTNLEVYTFPYICTYIHISIYIYIYTHKLHGKCYRKHRAWN